MGIRFLCDSCGKKLNIKEELAGKKGRCPKCNAVIKIPAQSTLENGETKAKEEEKSAPKASDAEKGSLEPERPQVATKPRKTKSAQSAKSDRSAKSDHSSEQELSPPPLPPSQESEDEDSGEKIPPSEINFTDNGNQPAESKPEPVDVLAQNPTAKWFVRPTSGGQFGPAESDVMKTWLTEGRIGRDSLVWCEGWEEWQSAAEVFAQELGESSEPVVKKEVETKPTPSTEPASSRMYSHRQSRQRARMMGIILVVGLAIVSIALAVVLFIVVNNSGKKKEQDEEKSGESDTALLYFAPQKNHNSLSHNSERSRQHFVL